MRGLTAGLVAVTAVALLVSELTMAPTGGERLMMVAVFAGAALAAGAGGAWLLARTRTTRSLPRALTVLAVAAVGVTTAVVAAAAFTMFLSTHDLVLVLIALGLGSAMALVLVSSTLDPVRRDLGALTDAAGRLGEGELRARSGVERSDDLGTLARALDDLADRLQRAEEGRLRSETSRRDLLVGVSHDLRTPLTSARVAIEAVRDGLATDVSRYLTSAGRDLELASRLVDDLFLLTRTGGGDLELELLPIDLVEVVDGVVEELGPLAAERPVTLRVIASDAVVVAADAHAVGRVVRNLVANAIEHAPSRSTVEIRLDLTDHGARIGVSDEGPGMSPAIAELAGTAPVPREDRSGFGLAVAGGLARAHGGDLRARPGPGGRVEVHLPQGGAGEDDAEVRAGTAG